MAGLSLSLLGGFEAKLDGRPISGFKTDKVRALLVYLAVEKERPHRRQTLVGLLWPDFPESAARASLRHALTNLRHVLGDDRNQPPYILVEGEVVQFNVSSDYWFDVQSFEELLKRGPGIGDIYPRLEEAVVLYRGSFLEGFSLAGSTAFEEWSLLVRQQLQQKALLALSQLTDWCAQGGYYEKASEYARRQLALEAWQEEAHCQLMRLLALRGQRSAAMAQYETCRRSLAEELGVEPSAATQQLYERIRDGKIGGPGEEKPPLHNLPAMLSPLIGREQELAEIDELLQTPTCRLLTLVGAGGSGKTHLALAAAARQVGNYRHGTYFVPLAALQSIESIPPAIARALGFTFYQGGEPFQQLLNYLRQKELLLLLDNFDQLLEGASLVVEILQAAPGVRIMTTSRSRLNLRDEHLVHVEGLDYPESPHPEPMQYAAVKLFLEGARRIQPHYQPAGDDLEQIAHICREVEGMPLAILLAASWMEILSPAEIARQISSHNPDFLEAGWNDVPERQRSMQTVFDYSWNLLTEREQQVFAGLAIFRGGFTQPAAEAVTGASLRDLMALINKSLLRHASSGRFDIHELLRQFAEGKLAQTPSRVEWVRQRHAVFYGEAIQKWAAALHGPGQAAVLQEMEVNFENAHTAWLWAAEGCKVEWLDRGMDGLGEFYEWRGHFQEGVQACQLSADGFKASIQFMPDDGSGVRERVLSRLLAWVGFFNRLLGHSEAARQAFDESLALLGRPSLTGCDTRVEKAFVLYQMGMLNGTLNCGPSRDFFTQSLELYRQIGDQWRMAQALAGLAGALGGLGHYREAKRLLEESLSIRRQLGDRRGIADALLINYGVGVENKYTEQQAAIRESMEIYQEIGDRAGVAECLLYSGWSLTGTGKYSEAYTFQEAAARIFEDLGMRQRLAMATYTMGLFELNQGLYEQGFEKIRIGLDICKEVGFQRGIATNYLVLGWSELLEGHLLQARQLMQDSVALYRHAEYLPELSESLAELANVERLLGQYDLARQYLSEALQIAEEAKHIDAVAGSLTAAALFLADQGEPERAVELYALVDRDANYSSSILCQDLYGKRIEEAAASLPAEVVAAAQARGQARDRDATLAELLVEFGNVLPGQEQKSHHGSD